MPEIESDIAKRLTATLRLGAVHGERWEREVVEKQIQEAITYIEELEAKLALRDQEVEVALKHIEELTIKCTNVSSE